MENHNQPRSENCYTVGGGGTVRGWKWRTRREKKSQEIPAGTRQIFLYVLLEKKKKKCSSSFHTGKIKMTPRERSELSLETSFYLHLLWPPAAFPQAHNKNRCFLIGGDHTQDISCWLDQITFNTIATPPPPPNKENENILNNYQVYTDLGLHVLEPSNFNQNQRRWIFFNIKPFQINSRYFTNWLK